MKILGLQKTTLLDFPGQVACTIFTGGCNFRCPFCHNAILATADDGEDLPAESFFSFLETRRKLLDGVCVSGGEPLLQPDIAAFCAQIKRRGFLVKIDTNGSRPDQLVDLIDHGLVDYVAMDVKNCQARLAETVGIADFDNAPLQRSIEILQTSDIDHEFRTTVVRELHRPADLEQIAEEISGSAPWYLQEFVDNDGVMAGRGTLHPWDPEDLRALLPRLREQVEQVALRGETSGSRRA